MLFFSFFVLDFFFLNNFGFTMYSVLEYYSVDIGVVYLKKINK